MQQMNNVPAWMAICRSIGSESPANNWPHMRNNARTNAPLKTGRE